MYIDPATPRPRPGPSLPWRSFQPDAFSTSSRHLRKPLEVIFCPFTVSTNSPMKLRRLVERHLEGEAGLDRAVAALGPAGGLVRVHAVAVESVGLEPVRPGEEL